MSYEPAPKAAMGNSSLMPAP